MDNQEEVFELDMDKLVQAIRSDREAFEKLIGSSPTLVLDKMSSSYGQLSPKCLVEKTGLSLSSVYRAEREIKKKQSEIIDLAKKILKIA